MGAQAWALRGRGVVSSPTGLAGSARQTLDGEGRLLQWFQGCCKQRRRRGLGGGGRAEPGRGRLGRTARRSDGRMALCSMIR